MYPPSFQDRDPIRGGKPTRWRGYAREKVGGELVIASGDATEFLEAAEGVLDEVPTAVSIFIIADDALTVATARDDWNGTCIVQRAAQLVGIAAYRKLHDDLLDHGETCCPNRVARLTRSAGIKAQIGYKRRPGSHGGKPSLAVMIDLYSRRAVGGAAQGSDGPKDRWKGCGGCHPRAAPERHRA